jgi:hypothetical protein
MAPDVMRDVDYAVRLGWTLAEFRGRVWYEDHVPIGLPPSALPLTRERSNFDRMTDCHDAIKALVTDLHAEARPFESGTTLGDAINEAAARIKDLREPPTEADPSRTQVRQQLRRLSASWDREIRASLHPKALHGYELGRGFGEARWELEVDDGVSRQERLQSLLGSERVSQLTRILRILRARFDQDTWYALKASLEGWSAQTSRRKRSQSWIDAALNQLRQQSDIWHDLLLLELRADDLVTPELVLRTGRQLAGKLRVFTRWQVVLLTVAGLLVAGGAAALTVSIGDSALFHAVGAFTAAAGALWIGVTGVTTGAKNSASGLFVQLRQAFNAQLAARAATVLPEDGT